MFTSNNEIIDMSHDIAKLKRDVVQLQQELNYIKKRLRKLMILHTYLPLVSLSASSYQSDVYYL